MNAAERNTFTCRRCGACCRVPGYVRLRSGEAERLADHLGTPPSEFVERYTRVTDDRTGLSLVERPDHSCIFLTDEDTCRVDPVKPLQCRTFPTHWNYPGYEQDCQAARQENS